MVCPVYTGGLSCGATSEKEYNQSQAYQRDSGFQYVILGFQIFVFYVMIKFSAKITHFVEKNCLALKFRLMRVQP